MAGGALKAILSLAALSSTTIVGSAQPARIASMNVCTDQLLLALVPPERIASLSYLSADPRTSAVAEEVGPFRRNRGVAEEIVALAPDLIVTGNFGFRPTVMVLRQLGYAVVELPMAERLADVAANLRILGAAVGEPERAAELISAFEADVARLTRRNRPEAPLFAKYDVNGWSTGQNSLVADIVHRAGFQMPADRLGHGEARRLSLEQLLLLRPAVIDFGTPWNDPPALASETFHHPALSTLLQSTRLIQIPEPLWICGTLRSIEALALLRNERDALMRNGRDSER